MDAKTLKRVIRAVLAVALLVLAGRELATAGLTTAAFIAGGAGLLFLLAAITGKG